VAAKVREVTFSGADFIDIVADPGTAQYPAPPHWLDVNLNGVIDFPEDRALPVGYPRNTDSVVSAHFKATIQNFPYPPSNVTLKVRGSNANATHSQVNYIVPETTVTLTGDDLYLPPTTISNPFPTFVNHGQLTINWEFSGNGGGWTSAGQTSNELYVTLDTPSTSPVYHTLIHTSVPISAAYQAQTELRVIAETWKNFVPTDGLLTKHIEPLFNGNELRYYDEWDTPNNSYQTLLANLDGQCFSFAQLFKHSLKAAGVTFTPLELFRVYAISTEGMLIDSWGFNGPGTANVMFNNEMYPYLNTLEDPTENPANPNGGLDIYWEKTNGVWGYYWGDTVEAFDEPGESGQWTNNPKSTFTDHTIVLINGQFYDPSYGTGPFDTLQEWEDASVAGFYTVWNPAANDFRLVFRENPEGPNVTGNVIPGF
jgi:hypothetical protein